MTAKLGQTYVFTFLEKLVKHWLGWDAFFGVSFILEPHHSTSPFRPPTPPSPPTPPHNIYTILQSFYPRTWLKPISKQAIKDRVSVFKQLVGYILFEMTISQLWVPCSSVVALID